jgi:hypothetical protein
VDKMRKTRNGKNSPSFFLILSRTHPPPSTFFSILPQRNPPPRNFFCRRRHRTEKSFKKNTRGKFFRGHRHSFQFSFKEIAARKKTLPPSTLLPDLLQKKPFQQKNLSSSRPAAVGRSNVAGARFLSRRFPSKQTFPAARKEEGTFSTGGEMKPYRDLQVFFCNSWAGRIPAFFKADQPG